MSERVETGWNAGIILRKDREFSRTELSRRVELVVLGRRLPVATVEDTIIAKLEWAKVSGGSERQLEDVAELVALCGETLDAAYVAKWVANLELAEMWQRIAEKV